jgi:hypothetical protein
MAYTLTDYKYHNLRTEYKEDGLYYKTQLSVHNNAETSTVLNPGVLATWAPTTAYVLSWQRMPWNQDGDYEILAKDVDRCTQHVSPKGTEFKKSFYVLDANRATFLTANYFGTDAYQGGAGWALRASYVFDFTEKRLGGNWMITLMSIDPNYHTGLRSRMTMID